MSDFLEYNSFSSDEETNKNEEKVVADRSCQPVPLNFTTYEMFGVTKQLELGIPLQYFDSTKLSRERCEDSNNLCVLHDGKMFRIFIKAFSRIVKRRKCFRREKHIKIKDSCVSRLLWEVFWNIEELLRQVVNKDKKFCWFVEWYRIWLTLCDKRLTPMHVYHFEEASIAIEEINLIDETEYSKEFRLITEMVDAHVLLPGQCYKEYKKGEATSLLN